MLEFGLLVAGYVVLLFLFRIVGGIGRAAEALETWGMRSSAKRRAAVERRLRLR